MDGPGHPWMLKNGRWGIRGSMDGLDPPLAPNTCKVFGVFSEILPVHERDKIFANGTFMFANDSVRGWDGTYIVPAYFIRP